MIGKENICSKFQAVNSVEINDGTGATKNTYTLDRIFDPDTTQDNFYNNVIEETIIDVLKGVNGTVFAYGQSGSGKTYTMYGNDLLDDSKGVIPRSM